MNSLHDVVDDFLTAQAGEVSGSTRRWYRRRLTDFCTFAGPVDVDDVTPALLRSYRAHLVDRQMSPHSVHGYQRAVRRLFSWLVDEKVIDHNVARDVPLVRLPHQAPKALSDEDLARILARLPAEGIRDRAIILFLADTGCRVGGLCSLTLDSVDLVNRSAAVIEKGQKGRRVYYTEMTAEALKLYMAVRPETETAALFVTNSGTALSTNGVRLMLERVGRRAGVRGRCNAHSFRHAFARSFLRNGGNLAALGRILGHTPGSTVTARYYAVWDDRELQEYHDRYSPLAKVSGDRAEDDQSSAHESKGT
jgi:site-specific recombinase XerD